MTRPTIPSLPAPGGTAGALIARLGMQRIPVEGCWFAATWGSSLEIPAASLPARYGGPRRAGSAILALVTRADFSAMHRLATDEIWHFHAGDPIEMLLLHPDGRERLLVLGPDVLADQHPQVTVPAATWMGARPLRHAPDAYSLFGTTMAPGFDDRDFEPGYRDLLQAAHPAVADLIAELTRDAMARRPAP